MRLLRTWAGALGGYLSMLGIDAGDSSNAVVFTFFAAIWAAIALPLLYRQTHEGR